MQYFRRRFKLKRFIIFVTLLVGVSLFFAFTASSQTVDTAKASKLKVETFANVGLVNQYVWRGMQLDGKPNIQPVLGLAVDNFEVGAAGTLSFLNNYSEAALFASYKYKFLKLSVTDLYIDLSANNQDYFNYSDTIGYHHLFCDLSFVGTEKVPLKLTVSTLVHSGWDLDSTSKGKFTTYVEAKYPLNNWEFCVGAVTGQSDFYLSNVDGFSVVNISAAYNYSIKFSDSYSLPVVSQLCVNPQAQKIYFTFGITF